MYLQINYGSRDSNLTYSLLTTRNVSNYILTVSHKLILNFNLIKSMQLALCIGLCPTCPCGICLSSLIILLTM